MTLRLEEMHPAIVHFPVAFLPVAVGADFLGRATGSRPLCSFARTAIMVGAAGAVAAGVTGLIAGEEVNVEGESRDMLMTHRNLNFLATLVLGGMALWRFRRTRPNAGYLAIGGVATAVLGYTAYLGGSLISKFGVEVAPAGGVYRPEAPALGSASVSAFGKAAATDLVHGVEHMVEEVGQGKLVPALFGRSKTRKSADVASEPRAATNSGSTRQDQTGARSEVPA